MVAIEEGLAAISIENDEDGSVLPLADVEPQQIIPVTGARCRAYRVASKHPPGLRGVSATQIIRDRHASRFLEAVQDLLDTKHAVITVQYFDRFDLYKRVTLQLPLIPEANPNSLANIVRASPPVPAAGRCPCEPAHLDFALVRTGERNDHTKGTPLEGT